MCPVVGASVNEDDVRIAAASAGGEAFAEAVVPPGLACVPLVEVLLCGVGDRRTGEGYVDVQLRILQVVIYQSPPIGLAWKGKASVRGRVMCRIVARNEALEGRDGVTDDTDAFLGRLLCVRVGREPFDARIAVLPQPKPYRWHSPAVWPAGCRPSSGWRSALPVRWSWHCHWCKSYA